MAQTLSPTTIGIAPPGPLPRKVRTIRSLLSSLDAHYWRIGSIGLFARHSLEKEIQLPRERERDKQAKSKDDFEDVYYLPYNIGLYEDNG